MNCNLRTVIKLYLSLIFLAPFFVIAQSSQQMVDTYLKENGFENKSHIQKANFCLKTAKNTIKTNADSALVWNLAALEIVEGKIDIPKKILNSKEREIVGLCYAQLGYNYSLIPNYNLAKNYWNKALHIYKNDFCFEKAIIYHRIYDMHWVNGAEQKKELLVEKVYDLLESTDDSACIAACWLTIGRNYLSKSNSDTALYYFQKAKSYFANTDYTTQYDWSLNLSANVFLGQDNIELAFDYLKERVRNSESSDNLRRKISALEHLGIIYLREKKIEEALSYFNQVHIINKTVKSKIRLARYYHFISSIKSIENKNDSAIYYSLKSLDLVKKYSMGDAVVAMQLSRLGRLYKLANNQEKSVYYFKKAIELGKDFSPHYKAIRMLDLAKYCLQINRLDEAKKYALLSFNIWDQLNFPKKKMKSAELLSKIYEQNDELKLALEYHKLSKQILDTLNENEFEKILLKKESENKLLQSEKEVSILTKEKKISRLFLVLSILAGLLILIVGVFAYLRIQEKKNQVELNLKNQILLQLREVESLKDKLDHISTEKKLEVPIFEIDDFLSEPLSDREKDVLTELCKGKTNLQISKTLFISVNTVRTHLANIYEKMNVKNRLQAVNKAGNIKRKMGEL